MKAYPLVRSIGTASILVITAGILHANRLNAQECSNATTNGRFVVVCDGYLTPGPNAPLTPAKELAAVTGEDGIFTGTGTLSLGGIIVTQTVKGEEQVNPDCTGTITYHQTINGQPAPDFHDVFVISDHGKKINGMGADPGSVFSCTLTRLSRSDDDDH